MRMGKPGGEGVSGKRRVRARLGLCLFGSFIPKRAEENLRNGSTCVMGRWGFVRWFSLISCLIGVQKFQNILKTKTQKNSSSKGREEGQRLAIQSRWAHLSSGKPESTPDQEGSASMPSQPLCSLLLTLILTRLVREVTVAIVQMLREIILVHSSWVGSAEQELAPLR